MSGRVTLTKAVVTSQRGQELLEVLDNITADGDLSADEVSLLYRWLAEEGDDVPAFRYLRTLIEDIAADGVLTPGEMLDLFMAIERVLPKAIRERVVARRIEAGILLGEPPVSAWELDPITPAQRSYLQSLGSDPRRFPTKGAASREIERLLSGEGSISNRHMMVLRFWDSLSVAPHGKAAVNAWIDDLYVSNPDYLAAWNLWKSETRDRGRQDDPSIVPIGIGFTYLRRLKQQAGGGGRKLLIALIIAATLVCVILALR